MEKPVDRPSCEVRISVDEEGRMCVALTANGEQHRAVRIKHSRAVALIELVASIGGVSVARRLFQAVFGRKSRGAA